MIFGSKNQKIDDLERDLYSRDAPLVAAKKRPSLSPNADSADKTWQVNENESSELPEVKANSGKVSLVSKVFIASALFFVVAAGIAAYVILGGLNVISSKNVDITVRGLSAVSAGEEVSLDILIENNNKTSLRSGTIYVEYPSGTRRADDITRELVRDQIDLGSVTSSSVVTKNVKAVFFGEKDSIKEIRVSVDYQADSSNATFTKEKIYEITIKSSPIIMNVEVPKEVNAGQEIQITAEVVSNSSTLVRDLLLRADYPFGFTFLRSQPQVNFDSNVWRLGDLAPNEKRTITITGRMDGQNEEERTFRFTAGTASAADERQIAVGFLSAQETLFIKRAFVGLDLRFNNQSGDSYSAAAGERIQGVLTWTNNLPIAINDASIQIRFSGQGFDRSRLVSGTGGFFRSIDNSINWDKNSIPSLANIQPGSSGSVSFSFFTVSGTSQLGQGRNLDVAVDTTMKGSRIQGGAPQEVSSTIAGSVKIGTNLSFDGRSVYSTGPFSNSGPMPPRVDQETTYTVVMSLANSLNDASNVTVSTQLPPNVSWLNRTNPSTEQISYDESSRTVVWVVPELRAGVGHSSASREAAFQVSILPSLSQLNQVPPLTGAFLVRGTDKFTGAALHVTRAGLDTRIASDPAYRNGQEIVGR